MNEGKKRRGKKKAQISHEINTHDLLVKSMMMMFEWPMIHSQQEWYSRRS